MDEHTAESPDRGQPSQEEVRLRELESWVSHYKRVLDTHQDFNDLIMRTRTAGLALIQAVFGAAAFSLTRRNAFVTVFDQPVHIAAFVILFGLGMVYTLYRIDHTYYFRMLVDSVTFGMKLEKNAPKFHTAKSPFGLTTAITEGAEPSSPSWRWFKEKVLNKPEPKPVEAGTRRSGHNVRLFYAVPALLGIIFLVAVLTAVNPSSSPEPSPSPSSSEP